MYGPKWPCLLRYGSRDMRRIDFLRVNELSTDPPILGRHKARVLFSYLSLFKGARSGKKPHLELDLSQALASSPPFLLSFSQKRDCSRMSSQRPHFCLYPHLSVRPCLAFHTYSHFLIFLVLSHLFFIRPCLATKKMHSFDLSFSLFAL